MQINPCFSEMQCLKLHFNGFIALCYLLIWVVAAFRAGIQEAPIEMASTVVSTIKISVVLTSTG